MAQQKAIDSEEVKNNGASVVNAGNIPDNDATQDVGFGVVIGADTEPVIGPSASLGTVGHVSRPGLPGVIPMHTNKPFNNGTMSFFRAQNISQNQENPNLIAGLSTVGMGNFSSGGDYGLYKPHHWYGITTEQNVNGTVQYLWTGKGIHWQRAGHFSGNSVSTQGPNYSLSSTDMDQDWAQAGTSEHKAGEDVAMAVGYFSKMDLIHGGQDVLIDETTEQEAVVAMVVNGDVQIFRAPSEEAMSDLSPKSGTLVDSDGEIQSSIHDLSRYPHFIYLHHADHAVLRALDGDSGEQYNGLYEYAGMLNSHANYKKTISDTTDGANSYQFYYKTDRWYFARCFDDTRKDAMKCAVVADVPTPVGINDWSFVTDDYAQGDKDLGIYMMRSITVDQNFDGSFEPVNILSSTTKGSGQSTKKGGQRTSKLIDYTPVRNSIPVPAAEDAPDLTTSETHVCQPQWYAADGIMAPGNPLAGYPRGCLGDSNSGDANIIASDRVSRESAMWEQMGSTLTKNWSSEADKYRKVSLNKHGEVVACATKTSVDLKRFSRDAVTWRKGKDSRGDVERYKTEFQKLISDASLADDATKKLVIVIDGSGSAYRVDIEPDIDTFETWVSANYANTTILETVYAPGDERWLNECEIRLKEAVDAGGTNFLLMTMFDESSAYVDFTTRREKPQWATDIGTWDTYVNGVVASGKKVQCVHVQTVPMPNFPDNMIVPNGTDTMPVHMTIWPAGRDVKAYKMSNVLPTMTGDVMNDWWIYDNNGIYEKQPWSIGSGAESSYVKYSPGHPIHEFEKHTVPSNSPWVGGRNNEYWYHGPTGRAEGLGCWHLLHYDGEDDGTGWAIVPLRRSRLVESTATETMLTSLPAPTRNWGSDMNGNHWKGCTGANGTKSPISNGWKLFPYADGTLLGHGDFPHEVPWDKGGGGMDPLWGKWVYVKEDFRGTYPAVDAGSSWKRGGPGAITFMQEADKYLQLPDAEAAWGPNLTIPTGKWGRGNINVGSNNTHKWYAPKFRNPENKYPAGGTWQEIAEWREKGQEWYAKCEIYKNINDWESGWFPTGAEITGFTDITSISLDNSGLRVCIADSGANQVKVYEYSSATNAWSQLGSTITTAGGDISAELHGDGDIVVIGQPNVTATNAGSTWDYSTYVHSHANTGGWSGSYNATAPGANAGKVVVYHYTGGSPDWTALGDPIYGVQGEDSANFLPGENFGYSVAIARDVGFAKGDSALDFTEDDSLPGGPIIAVGAPNFDANLPLKQTDDAGTTSHHPVKARIFAQEYYDYKSGTDTDTDELWEVSNFGKRTGKTETGTKQSGRVQLWRFNTTISKWHPIGEAVGSEAEGLGHKVSLDEQGVYCAASSPHFNWEYQGITSGGETYKQILFEGIGRVRVFERGFTRAQNLWSPTWKKNGFVDTNEPQIFFHRYQYHPAAVDTGESYDSGMASHPISSVSDGGEYNYAWLEEYGSPITGPSYSHGAFQAAQNQNFGASLCLRNMTRKSPPYDPGERVENYIGRTLIPAMVVGAPNASRTRQSYYEKKNSGFVGFYQPGWAESFGKGKQVNYYSALNVYYGNPSMTFNPDGSIYSIEPNQPVLFVNPAVRGNPQLGDVPPKLTYRKHFTFSIGGRIPVTIT